MAPITANQLAQLLNGYIEGDPNVVAYRIAKIEEAVEGCVSFVANPKYADYLYTSQASILIVNESLALQKPVKPTLIRVKDAYSAFAYLMELYAAQLAQPRSGVEQPCFIHPEAIVEEGAYIGAFSYIGAHAYIGRNAQIYPLCYVGDSSRIGASSTLYAGVIVYHDCEIGERVIIHSGTVIGSDGFGFAPQENGQYKKIPQMGRVIIEDEVEIGANTTIDRATIGATIIRKGVKLDNLIQIAHNVEIGAHTAIAAQAGISGSTKIGRHCVIGGQAGLVGHIQIADQTRINAQSGVSKSVHTPGAALTGTPAFDYKSALKSQAIFRNLPDLEKRVRELEEMVRQLLAEKERV
ncbi:MAG: UDP-3-O-(3-hydroxymyristoyl)glucosamine N-acyltransferase [Thermoflavifilum sp.]|nr:UDP-3-O-(3-hydroxymyristoyl)glucosamine N-acyltransferase [Thermoflavifilum sp.]